MLQALKTATVYFCESREAAAVALDVFEEHLLGAHPVFPFAVQRLIDDHALRCLGIERRADEAVLAALEMTEVANAVVGQWILREHFLGQWRIMCAHFLGGRSVPSREVARVAVMLTEKRLEVRQRVLFAA